MKRIAIPFMLNNTGRLESCDEAQSLEELFRIMFSTPEGAWEPMPAFGVAELVVEAQKKLDSREILRARMNEVLEKFDSEYQVDKINPSLSELSPSNSSADGSGVNQLQIKLRSRRGRSPIEVSV